MQKPGSGPPGKRWFGSYVPLPIVDSFKVVAWPRRPLTIKTSATGQTVTFHEPPPVGVDDQALAAFFTHLGARERAKDIVYAARQYKAALELIEQRPETAYLALVSVVETLAGIALADYKPEEIERIENKANVAKRARKLGLSDADANALALEAAKSEKWSKRKFVKFCKDFCALSELRPVDPLFIVPEFLTPAETEFEDCLKRIYDARSTNLHAAVPFPPGTGIGTSPMLKIRELPLHPLGKLELPPAVWFERVVSIATRKFLLADQPAPFIEGYSAGSSEAAVS
jgi:hypothetical protein